MRSLLLSLALVALAGPALAGTPYTPLKLAPAKTVTPSADLIEQATAFLANVRKGDGDAIGAALAPKIAGIDGGLELSVVRRKEVMGPYKSTEEMLSALANYIGGLVQEGTTAEENLKFRLDAEREYLVGALTDGQPWGLDPMVKGATCTYAVRTYDIKAIAALSKKTGVASSSFVYVDAPYELHKAADDKSEVVGTMQTDLLYALDYDTDAPLHWIAVTLPDGSTGFANQNKANFQKPYAGGICFAKTKDGVWQVVAQSSTSL